MALADLDTNIVEDQSYQQMKKTDINAMDGENKQPKKNTSSKKAPAEPTWDILNFTKFDMAAQKMDEMCKLELLLQTVIKMSSSVDSLKKDRRSCSTTETEND